MKWKCLDCYAVFCAAGGRQANCPQCGSVNCFDCNVEPVSRLQQVSELPPALERLPVKPGKAQRGPVRLVSQAGLNEEIVGRIRSYMARRGR